MSTSVRSAALRKPTATQIARAAEACELNLEELRRYQRVRDKIAALEAEIRQLEKQGALKETAARIRQFAEPLCAAAGGIIQYAGFLFERKLGGRYPKWRDEFLRLAGEAEVEAVLNRTEPSVSITCEPVLERGRVC